MITIVNYGVGNLGSIRNMLKKINIKAIISSSKEDIKISDKLILPGVGSFDNAMSNLKKMGIIGVLNEAVLKKRTPILGICLGMQLFAKKSEEGKLPGLGWIDAEAVRFRINNKDKWKVPHMGWNTVKIKKDQHVLNSRDSNRELKFYFVHSYHLECKDQNIVLAETYHGYDFVSGIQKDNIIGVQFHPEKSHKFGMDVLGNFVAG